MTQGKTQGLRSKAASARHARKAAANPKKGKRIIAPKKQSLIKQAAMQKDLTAKINITIEQQMVSAASSGKLTIMKNTMPEEPTSGSLKTRHKSDK